MAPNLVLQAERGKTLAPEALWDPALIPAPARFSPSSLRYSWAADWLVAFFLATGLINTWIIFLDPLVLEHLPAQAQEVFFQSARLLLVMLTPILHFTLSFLGVHQSGQTLGQRLFRHHMHEEGELASWENAARWSAGSTLAFAFGGFALFKEGGWLERWSGLSPVSADFREHTAHFQSLPPTLPFRDLVAEAVPATPEEYGRAA